VFRANVFPVLSSGGDRKRQIDSGYLSKVEVIRGSDGSAYKLSQREHSVLVLSRDGSAKGQDYLLAVFGVQGENKLLLIFAVKCLSCLQTDCGQRIICFIMYPHSSYLFFSMSKVESSFLTLHFFSLSALRPAVCMKDEK